MRELLERGESTPAGLVIPGGAALRAAGRVRAAFELANVVVVACFVRFLGFGSSSFSLSAPSSEKVEIASLFACQYALSAECSSRDKHTSFASQPAPVDCGLAKARDETVPTRRAWPWAAATRVVMRFRVLP